jgi:hypothetical protein
VRKLTPSRPPLSKKKNLIYFTKREKVPEEGFCSTASLLRPLDIQLRVQQPLDVQQRLLLPLDI